MVTMADDLTALGVRQGPPPERPLPLFAHGKVVDEVFVEQLLQHPVCAAPARLAQHADSCQIRFGHDSDRFGLVPGTYLHNCVVSSCTTARRGGGL